MDVRCLAVAGAALAIAISGCGGNSHQESPLQREVKASNVRFSVSAAALALREGKAGEARADLKEACPGSSVEEYQEAELAFRSTNPDDSVSELKAELEEIPCKEGSTVSTEGLELEELRKKDGGPVGSHPKAPAGTLARSRERLQKTEEELAKVKEEEG